MNRNWNYIWIAGLLEIGWVSGLKHAHNAWTWGLTVISLVLSTYLLIRSTKNLPVGTAYAVFTGIGTAGTVAAEMLLFGEPFRIVKLLLILLLLVGVIGLKIVTAEPEAKEGH
ncbi:multidrug efflux SMR transporter [Paenibacillus sp. M1]|uniref:Multidrug efflux SMR transporter n=1 Tax=Paenibacillus haidiansis TaxID=1574488 RepID=A0ABU7VQD7_9BACL